MATPVLNGFSHLSRLGASSPSLRERVFVFLDKQLDSIHDILEIDDDDPYILWTTAQAIDVDPSEIAEFVRQWRTAALARARIQPQMWR